MIVKALLNEGWAVQLKHFPKETSWGETKTHGFVTIKSAAGAVLFSKPGMQHNRNLSAYQATLEDIRKVARATPKALDDASTTDSETDRPRAGSKRGLAMFLPRCLRAA